jgi:hypothetical protein
MKIQQTSAARAVKWALAIGISLAASTSAVLAQPLPTALSSDELMKQIVELGGNAEKKDMYKSYMQELITRAKAKQPSAMYNFGWYRFQICSTLKKQNTDVSNAPMCAQALDDIKAVAENIKISTLFIAPDSMSMLGEMYRDGIGTKPSRFLAADWFVKAAKQKSTNGDREGAIRSLEDAVNIVPDLPAAIELRATLLK